MKLFLLFIFFVFICNAIAYCIYPSGLAETKNARESASAEGMTCRPTAPLHLFIKKETAVQKFIC